MVISATSSITIEKLRGMLETHGIPDVIVSDNRVVFTSDKFGTIMNLNGIRHVKSIPYHYPHVYHKWNLSSRGPHGQTAMPTFITYPY